MSTPETTPTEFQPLPRRDRLAFQLLLAERRQGNAEKADAFHEHIAPPLAWNYQNMAVEDDAAKERDILRMRSILGCAALALAFSTATIPAQAKGCIKGALIGGTAGHFAGHHGLLGAAAGCVIGRHEANRQRQLKLQQQNSQPGTAHYR